MLHVILQILAVIGIILLCILGLVLLLLALILFVPIRYRINGKRFGEDMELAVKATYLLHMLTVKFDYPEPASIIVRLFGIKLYDSKQKKEEENAEQIAEPAKSTSDVKKTEESVTKAEDNTGKTSDLTESDKAVEPADAGNAADRTGNENASEQSADAQSSSQSDTEETETLEEKRTLKEKIQYTFRSICDKIKNIIQKIKDIFANISYYKEVLLKIENQRMYVRVKKRLFKVLKSIRPRTIKANVRLGTGSPDTTAYIYGIYGMLQPVFGKNVKYINIDLDFDEAVYEGTIFLKGKITIFTIAVQAIKILLDKQVQIFIKQLKREE